MSDNKILETLIKNQTSWYEDQLLASVISNPSFYNSVTRDVVCVPKNNKRNYNDFTTVTSNLIYMFCDNYYKAQNSTEHPVPKVWITTLLKSYKQKEEILSGEYEVALEKVNELYNIDTKYFVESLANGFNIWLSLKRSMQLISEQNSKINVNLDDLKTQVEGELKKVKSNDSPNFRFGEKSILKSKQTDEEEGITFQNRYTYPLDGLNTMTGGLGKKEGLLFNIPSGGGKTVIACQFGSHFAIEQNANVLLITTEQPPEELIPRIISCRTKIPFNHIQDGIYEENLNNNQIDIINDVQNKLSNKFVIADWSNRGKRIKQHLEKEINYQIDNGFTPDIILFDWIGGGLGDADYKDPQHKRNDYMESAECFTTMCKTFNFGGIAFAQADAAQSEGVRFITNKQLTLAKQLHESFTIAIGVSALMKSNKAKDSNSTHDVYERIQWFNPYKVRKGTPKAFKVLREFEYQKFNNLPNLLE